MNLKIKFRIDVQDDKDLWHGPMGTADMDITVPRDLADVIEPGNLFKAIYFAALRKFDEECQKDGGVAE